jgi:small subunit ribosomal protein S2
MLAEVGGESGGQEKLEINKDLLLKYRVHLGRNIKTAFSEKFIYAVHPRGFYLIDLSKTLERLEVAARFLSLYEPEEVLIFSGREYGFKAIELMSRLTGFKCLYGRFLPGTLTNYILSSHHEVSVLLVIDHTYDRQAVNEAVKTKIPIVSFVDTNSNGEYVDLAIPANNKGRYSIAALLWILTVMILRERGLLKSDEIIDVPIEEFIYEKRMAEV